MSGKLTIISEVDGTGNSVLTATLNIWGQEYTVRNEPKMGVLTEDELKILAKRMSESIDERLIEMAVESFEGLK